MRDIDVFAKPKRKKASTSLKPTKTAKTFKKPIPKKKAAKKKLSR
jgi:hypothetical protein